MKESFAAPVAVSTSSLFAHRENEDPDKTFVQPVFTFIPDEARLSEWRGIWEEHFKRFPPNF